MLTSWPAHWRRESSGGSMLSQSWIVKRLAAGIALVVVGFMPLGAATSPAHADGGSFPSQAPQLVRNTTVSGGDDLVDTFAICCQEWQEAGKAGVKYYKIKLKFGDQLTLDYENVTGTQTGLCVL